MVSQEQRFWDAKIAVEWAGRKCSYEPSDQSNLEVMLTLLQQRKHDGQKPITRQTELDDCLFRLYVMADPSLIDCVSLHYDALLDSQEGTNQMVAWYRAITGKAPKVRSWLYALQEDENNGIRNR